MAALWEPQGYNESFGDYIVSPYQNAHTITSTPLNLSRDWSDAFYLPTNNDADDFQSNHHDFEIVQPSALSSLAGLGIRNIDLNHSADSRRCLSSRCPQQATALDQFDFIYPNDSSSERASKETNGDLPGFQSHRHEASVLNSSWSLSPILQAAELAMGNNFTDLTSSDLGLDGAVPSDVEMNISLSFEELSASTGLSIADFAAHISATAEATLKHMATASSLGSVVSSNALHGSLRFLSHLDSQTPRCSAPGLFLPDLLTKKDVDSWNSNCEGVNPADILPPEPMQSPPSQPISIRIPHLQQDDNTLSGNSVCDNMSVMSANVQQSGSYFDRHLGSGNTPGYELSYLPLPEPTSHKSGQLSDDELSLFQSPSSSEISPPLPPISQKKSTTSNGGGKRRIVHRVIETSGPRVPEYHYECDQRNLPPINLGTPVLDAHRGMDIEVLKAKAERYRLRNQGREYDKRWLLSFAGKLSSRGELVDEFRCYVTGCKQSNKRRDHILIHVGAHLDQRPFKCMHCDSRFLRKNECKRHELSHSGLRPFSCHLCPYPATTFVRQDLLKRHMKRTHQLDSKTDKENDDTCRPKKRVRY